MLCQYNNPSNLWIYRYYIIYQRYQILRISYEHVISMRNHKLNDIYFYSTCKYIQVIGFRFCCIVQGRPIITSIAVPLLSEWEYIAC